MQSIVIISGKPALITGSGILLGHDGQTLGQDTYFKVDATQWLPADKVPNGVIKRELQNGTLKSGILYGDKLYEQLNIHDSLHRLIAAKVGLEKAFNEQNATVKGDSAMFKAQISDPMNELVKQVEALELKVLERKVDALELKVLEQEVATLEIKLEKRRARKDDWLANLKTAAFTISTSTLEILAKAAFVADYVEDNDSLLADAAKMAYLRKILRDQ